MLHQRIENDFSFHPATPYTGPKHDRIRRLCGTLAHELAFELGDSRELSLALTNLEQVMMWANAGIARNQPVAGFGTPGPMEVGGGYDLSDLDRRRDALIAREQEKASR